MDKIPSMAEPSEQGLSEGERASLRLSLYSMTSSNFHTALNTLASVALVANSALAFTAISRGLMEVFSFGTLIYCSSFILYIASVVLNFIPIKAVYNTRINSCSSMRLS